MCDIPAREALPKLIDELVPKDDEQRRPAMEAAVKAWPAEERQRLSDDMSTLLTRRAVFVQNEALAAHERGEDVMAASRELQARRPWSGTDMIPRAQSLDRSARSTRTASDDSRHDGAGEVAGA